MAKLAHEIDEVEDKFDELIRLVKECCRMPVASFLITGDTMNINPGQSTKLTATPLDANGAATQLPSGDVPAWGVSDPSKVSVVPSADGLSLDVTVNAQGATPGDVVFQITDGVIAAATGSFTLTIAAVGPAPVASFSVAASTPV